MEHEVSNLNGHLTVADQRMLARFNLLSQYVVQNAKTWDPFCEWVGGLVRPVSEADGLNVTVFIEDQARVEEALGAWSKEELLDLAFSCRSEGTEGDGM